MLYFFKKNAACKVSILYLSLLILISRDITAGGAAIPKSIPVYCDMPMKSTDLIFTNAFEYIDQKAYILTPQQKVDFKKPVVSSEHFEAVNANLL